jgi:hypothetical protein
VRADLPAVGDRVALRLPEELLGISAVSTWSAATVRWTMSRAGGWVRLYWNLRADGAAPFVAAATRLLNSAEEPAREEASGSAGAGCSPTHWSGHTSRG